MSAWRDSQLRTLGDRTEYRRRKQNAWIALAMFAAFAMALWAGRELLG